MADLKGIEALVEAGLAPSKARAYQVARHLPPGVVVRAGRSVYVNERRLQEWIESGGDAAGKE